MGSFRDKRDSRRNIRLLNEAVGFRVMLLVATVLAFCGVAIMATGNPDGVYLCGSGLIALQRIIKPYLPNSRWKQTNAIIDYIVKRIENKKH